MISKTEFLELLLKTLIAGSIIIGFYIILTVLMFVSDDFWILPIIFGFINGIAISKLFKYSINTIFTIFLSFTLTIIDSILIFIIISLLITFIKPLNLLLIKIFENVSFYNFIGMFAVNMIGGIVYFSLSFFIFLIYLIILYVSKP